ncbi:hypothetical protein SAMN05216490_0678 [Mucilaginibacter mallensis]|uniref:MYXO-CTERM domain-containing protein n=1 Tax=Mucilaginibacter mallensis TaxID=652787 RepID=A0A1H1Q2D4_MUCMA|nr:hypothetical protein [Mucilaginibacter mallensis]SDS17671.1 hypothetical protein SAMN05216490_0678 [Mucilaginibacter mallensis]
MKKITKSIALLFIINILMVTTVLAQVPCSGDPDDPGYNPNGCPLDTYVWILAIAALIFGATYLHRQQKAQSRA